MAGLFRGSLAASAIVLSFGVLKSPQKVVNASVEAPLLPGKKRLTFCFSIQMSKISGSLDHLPLGMVPLGGKRRLYSSHLIQSRGKFSLFHSPPDPPIPASCGASGTGRPPVSLLALQANGSVIIGSADRMSTFFHMFFVAEVCHTEHSLYILYE